MTIRKTSAWFVVNPYSVVLTWTCSTSKERAIHRFETMSEVDWNEQRKLGCRCVRLAIGPETKGGGS